jgi:hypothetical protein
MSAPKNLWFLTNATGNQSKFFSSKNVVQNINIFNNSDTSLTFTINRVPASEVGTPTNPYQTKHRARVSVSVSPNSSLVFENLKWVVDVGDYISIIPSNSIKSYTVFIDGVEIN